MSNAGPPSSTPPNQGTSLASAVLAERRRSRARWWLWYALTGALIAVLYTGQFSAGWYVKSQARSCIKKRDPQRALDWLQWSARLDSLDAEAEFLRARAYRKLGEFNLLRDHLERAHKLGYPVKTLEREQHLAKAQSGQLQEALPHFAQLLSDPQGDDTEICEAYVNGFALNRQYGDAFKVLTSWIADYPRDPQPYFIRGHIQVLLQRYKQAEADLRKALELDPRHSATIFELADVLEQLHQPAEALTYYNQAAKFPKFEMMSGVGQTRCLTILGKTDEARVAILQVIEKFPQEAMPHQLLGQLELEAGHYAEALKHLDIAAVKLGYDKELRNARGTALRGLKRTEEARHEFEFVEAASRALSRAQELREQVQSKTDDVPARFEIGQILLKYEEPREGVVWLQSVFNYAPQHRGAHQALADYYATRAKDDPSFKDLAARHLKAAQEAPPDKPAAESASGPQSESETPAAEEKP